MSSPQARCNYRKVLVLSLPTMLFLMPAGQAQIGASGTQSSYFAASRTSGEAPLTVTFCASAGITIDFGDGTSSGMGIARNGDCPMANSLMTRHTYTTAGDYQLTGLPCPSSTHGESCGEVARQASSVKIIVAPAR